MDSTYSTQFFGFTPRAFCDAMYNVMFDASSDAVQVMQQVLKEEWPPLASDEEMRQSSAQLRQEMAQIQDKVFDKLEVYLMNCILPIPAGILLPEDAACSSGDAAYSSDSIDAEDAALDAEIKELLAELKKVDSQILCARKEISQIDDLEKLAAKYNTDFQGTKNTVQKVNELHKLNVSKLEQLFKIVTDTAQTDKDED